MHVRACTVSCPSVVPGNPLVLYVRALAFREQQSTCNRLQSNRDSKAEESQENNNKKIRQ